MPEGGATESQLTGRANQLIGVKRYREAASTCQQGLGLFPNSLSLACLLSWSLTLQGEKQAALEAGQRAVAGHPGNEWPHRVLSIALGQLDRRAGSIEAARQSVALAPTAPYPLQVLTQALYRAGRYTEATDVANRLLAVAPAWVMTYTLLSMLALVQGRWREGETWARRGLEIDPVNMGVMNNLAYGLVKLGRIEEATTLFKETAKLHPYDGIARGNLFQALRARFRRTRILFLTVAGIGIVLLVFGGNEVTLGLGIGMIGAGVLGLAVRRIAIARGIARTDHALASFYEDHARYRRHPKRVAKRYRWRIRRRWYRTRDWFRGFPPLPPREDSEPSLGGAGEGTTASSVAKEG